MDIGCSPDNAIDSQHALTNTLADCPPLTNQMKQICQRLLAQKLKFGNGNGNANGSVGRLKG